MTDNWQDVDYTEAVENSAVRGDLEYELIISSTTAHEDKRFIVVLCEIANQEFAKLVSILVSYKPYSKDGAEPDAQSVNQMRLNQTRFFEGFGIPSGEDNFFSHELWKGKRATVILSNKEDSEYGEQNKIKRYVKPVSETY